MRYPVGDEVPFTAGISGIVFAVAIFSLGSPLNELILFAVWGLIYGIECLLRRPWRNVSALPQTPPAMEL